MTPSMCVLPPLARPLLQSSSVDICSRLMSRARLGLQCAFVGLQCSEKAGISLQTAIFSGHRAATLLLSPSVHLVVCDSGKS